MHYKNIAYTTLNSPNNSTSKKLIFDASIQFYLYIIVLMSNKTIVTVWNIYHISKVISSLTNLIKLGWIFIATNAHIISLYIVLDIYCSLSLNSKRCINFHNCHNRSWCLRLALSCNFKVFIIKWSVRGKI